MLHTRARACVGGRAKSANAGGRRERGLHNFAWRSSAFRGIMKRGWQINPPNPLDNRRAVWYNDVTMNKTDVFTAEFRVVYRPATDTKGAHLILQRFDYGLRRWKKVKVHALDFSVSTSVQVGRLLASVGASTVFMPNLSRVWYGVK